MRGRRKHRQRFKSPSGRTLHGFADMLRWMVTRRRGAWPKHVGNAPAPNPVTRVDDGAIRATVVGHSTVLLQVAGLNILTDPMWSRWAGPLPWLGIRRVRPPAIALDAVPPIDVVLLSHNHYDHLDRPTLGTLVGRDNPLIVTGLGVGRSVPSRRVVELDWWEQHPLGDNVRATYVPAEHFSARGVFDRNATLWGGFVLETPAGTIYFAGDTGAGEHFAAIRERFGPMTLSFLPIGAYVPRWFMAPVHMDPAEAVAASRTLDSQVSVAIHFGTFPLADDAFDAPVRELAQALAAQPDSLGDMDFRVPVFGTPIVVRRA